MPYELWEDEIAPPWLGEAGGANYIGALGYEKDWLIYLLKTGIKQRFPDYAYPDALLDIGSDRGIAQGISESLSAYATDIKNAWTLWQRAGTFLGLLNEFLRQGYSNVIILQQQWGAYSLSAGNLAITTYPLNHGRYAGRQMVFDVGQPNVVASQPQPQLVPYPGIGPPFPINGAVLNGQPGAGGVAAHPPGYLPNLTDTPGNIQTRRWARYAVLFTTPFPSNWTSTQATPLTTSTTPSLAEMNSIRRIITTWGPGGAVCVGITALISGRLRSWPIRTFNDGALWKNSQSVTWTALQGSTL